MDSQFLTFASMRFLFSLFFFAAFLMVLVFGLRFYLKGLGLGPDGSEIEVSHGEFKARASLKTVGAVLMLTSVVLGCLAYKTLPRATVGGKEGGVAPGGWRIEQGPIGTDAGAPTLAAPE
jgi:hypothetical protein